MSENTKITWQKIVPNLVVAIIVGLVSSYATVTTMMARQDERIKQNTTTSQVNRDMLITMKSDWDDKFTGFRQEVTTLIKENNVIYVDNASRLTRIETLLEVYLTGEPPRKGIDSKK